MATLLRHFADEFELDYSTLFIEDDAAEARYRASAFRRMVVGH